MLELNLCRGSLKYAFLCYGKNITYKEAKIDLGENSTIYIIFSLFIDGHLDISSR